ncbi:MAG: TlpA family protein disulfide reductase [Actinomycetota bacterium]
MSSSLQTPEAPLQGSESTSKPSYLRRLAFVAVPVIFIAILTAGVLVKAAPHAVVGTPVPAFRLPVLVEPGQPSRTLSNKDLEGHPIVFNFWSSRCITCRDEAPQLEAAWQRFKDQGVIVLGVDFQDTTEDALAFAREFGMDYPVVRDVNEVLVHAFGVHGYPETYFVDKDGKFFAIASFRRIGQNAGTAIFGPVQPAVLRSRIESMLAAAPN